MNYGARKYLEKLEPENGDGEPIHQQDKASTTDPDSTYLTKGNRAAELGYFDNYLIDNESCVIVGVQATAARLSQESAAARDISIFRRAAPQNDSSYCCSTGFEASRVASEFPVVHLKIRHRATGLTPPAVATQDLLEQTLVRRGSSRMEVALGRIILRMPRAGSQGRPAAVRRARTCSSVRWS